MGNIFVSHISDKGLISTIYKGLLQLKKQQPDFKMGEELVIINYRHTNGPQI